MLGSLWTYKHTLKKALGKGKIKKLKNTLSVEYLKKKADTHTDTPNGIMRSEDDLAFQNKTLEDFHIHMRQKPWKFLVTKNPRFKTVEYYSGDIQKSHLNIQDDYFADFILCAACCFLFHQVNFATTQFSTR